MDEIKKEVNEIEVVKPVTVKPKKVKTVVMWKMLDDVGTDESGEIRFKKGNNYELTKKQIDNFLKLKLICQI